MSTPETPQPSSRKGLIVRLVGATLMALLLLGIALPSMKSRDSLPRVLAFTFTPLILVYLGAIWSRAIETAGWALLILLLLMRLAG